MTTPKLPHPTTGPETRTGGGLASPPLAKRLPTSPGRQRARWRQATLLTIAAIALLPGLFQFARAEVGRWQLAMCYEAELDQKDTLAEGHLHRALAWSRHDQHIQDYHISFMIRRGRAHEVIGDTEAALLAARTAYEATPNTATRSRLIQALNLTAYVSALCNVNLDSSLQRINEALDLQGEMTNSAMLDTRGYVLWRLDRHEAALNDMNLALEEHKHEYLITRRVLQNRSTFVVDARSAARDMQRLDEGLAALYYHRALVNQSLGRLKQASRDLQRVTNLGFDPETGVF